MYNPLTGSKVGPELLKTYMREAKVKADAPVRLTKREEQLLRQLARMITEPASHFEVDLMNQVCIV